MDFGYEHLSGAGTAFKLIWAVGQQMAGGPNVGAEFKDFLVEALSLVAIATIADVVPLVDENRILATYGLKSLPFCCSPGLRALMERARVTGDEISAFDVAFKLAPRLNAAGRLGDAQAAVDMLTTTDTRHASDLAEHLEAQNRRRRAVQELTLTEAEKLLSERPELCERHCIVLSGRGWHCGVLGLVASRLAERYWRPAFVFSIEDDLARGSARSIPGFPLFEAVQECSDLLMRYGGHEGAAGLTLAGKHLPQFTERINQVALRMCGAEPPAPELQLEGELPLASVSPELVREIRKLAPFGEGNPQPLFAAGGLQLVSNPQIVGGRRDHLSFLVRQGQTTLRAGRRDHLSFLVRQGQTTLRAIGFGKAHWLSEMRERRGEAFSLAFEPRMSRFSGHEKLELRAEDLQWGMEHCIERRAV